MKQATKPFSYLAGKTLEKYGKTKSITLITNKTSYAHGALCKDCGTIPFCTQCDVAIGYHKDTHGKYFGLCHYCKATYVAPSICNHCQGHAIDFYGMGAQQIQELLSRIYSLDATLLDGSKLSSPNKVTQQSFVSKTFVATSLLLHPLPETDVLILLNADFSKQLPDYNARWNSFLQLYEAIAKHPGKQVIIQTYYPEDMMTAFACRQDQALAQQQELDHRTLL
jgi:primosomal protein N' (replication factor Y) (superfamily II helicase)